MSAGSLSNVLLPFRPGLTHVGKNSGGFEGAVATRPSHTPLRPDLHQQLAVVAVFLTMPSALPAIQMLFS